MAKNRTVNLLDLKMSLPDDVMDRIERMSEDEYRNFVDAFHAIVLHSIIKLTEMIDSERV